ncbi:MAG: hypothetical protein ACRDS0_15910 [Pseudonocardiaceae bacterium]
MPVLRDHYRCAPGHRHPPKVLAWSCALCGTEWVISVVNPHLRGADLTELLAARCTS